MNGWIRGQMTLLGAAFALAGPFAAQPAQAHQHTRHANHTMSGRDAARVIYAGVSHYGRYRSSFRSGFAGGTLQCVPFARENTGIELTGNAANWWSNASGVYERGARPEVGSILNFRGTSRMRLGHLAVVSNVLDSHTVQIDHANWSGRGVVTRNVTVVDVSPSNDWSAVRVAMGNGEFGSVYPTYGFIYDRPDKGTMLANAGSIRSVATAGSVVTASALNSAPLDFRPVTGGTPIVLAPQPDDEVAEAGMSSGPTARGGAAAGLMLPCITAGMRCRWPGMAMPAAAATGAVRCFWRSLAAVRTG